jgi:hypothetical protein
MRLPAGWRENSTGDVACPHRDVSCCPACAKHEEVVEVFGQHFWMEYPNEREALRREVAAANISRRAS